MHHWEFINSRSKTIIQMCFPSWMPSCNPWRCQITECLWSAAILERYLWRINDWNTLFKCAMPVRRGTTTEKRLFSSCLSNKRSIRGPIGQMIDWMAFVLSTTIKLATIPMTTFAVARLNASVGSTTITSSRGEYPRLIECFLKRRASVIEIGN